MTTPFDHILGQPRATALLASALQNDRIAHAYLIVGPAHTGKRTLVEAFASQLLGMPTEKSGDYKAVVGEGKSGGISIKQTRALIAECATPPLGKGHQVFVVFGADKLGGDAANNLLKPLEEPPPRTVFILVANRPDLILPTIRSRTQLIPTFPVDEAIIRQALIAQGVAGERATTLAGMAEGRIGWALQQASEPETEPFWPTGDLRSPMGRLEMAKALGDLTGPELKVAIVARLRTRWQEAPGGVGWDELSALERAVQRLDANVNAKLVVEFLVDESIIR
jgi:DNA polymerase III delta prime subunit